MYKLYFKKAEEPEIKLPLSGSYKKQENFRETSTSASFTMLKPLTVWITTNWGKFLRRWEYKTTVSASCHTSASQQATAKPGMEQQTDQVHHVTARLDESQAGVKIARRNINNLKYADDTTLTAESKEELKGL